MTTEDLEVIRYLEHKLNTCEYNAKTLTNKGLQKIYSNKALWLTKLLNLVKRQVKYAKWEYNGCNGGDIGYSDYPCSNYSCSNCQNLIVFDDNNELFPFCPYCGTKMDLER